MNKLFFDIETIPVEKNRHGILREIHQKKIDDKKKVDESSKKQCFSKMVLFLPLISFFLHFPV